MRRRRGHWIVLSSLVLLASCQSIPLFTGPDALPKPVDSGMPSKNSFRVSQFVFYADFELKKDQPLFKELSVLRENISTDLKLPPSNTLVQVYLFEDRTKYEAYMKGKYPDLPKRKAFFVAQPRRLGGADDLLVYTSWGKSIQQDLRHELTHAVLHSSLRDVPLWLDEGLAEYYEMPPSWNGVNYQHVAMLSQPNTKFNLERLEKLTDVKDMTPAEYREAWAWTHLMLKTTPEARLVLLNYLNDLRGPTPPGPLKARIERIFPQPEDAVRRHLADLDLGKPRTTTAQN